MIFQSVEASLFMIFIILCFASIIMTKNYFSIIYNQQRVIQQKRDEIRIRKKMNKQQNEICLQLIEEITRIRAVVRKMSSTELQNILSIMEKEGERQADNELLVSASQVLQTVSDDSLIRRIGKMKNPEAQQAAYYELVVSFINRGNCSR